MQPRPSSSPLPLFFGLLVLAVAAVSIGDMVLPRPHDGIVLDTDAPQRLVVREVLSGSGAEAAGIEPGDKIVGIAREALRGLDDAARQVNRFRIGEEVLYLVQGESGLREVKVRLGRRSLGDGTYLYTSALGFSFLFIGLFVLVRRPGLRASRLFFLLCCLFTLFLVCRMRPPSYSGIDGFVLGIGTLALIFLAPAALHFYLIFPRPIWLETAAERGWLGPFSRLRKPALGLLYALPPLVYGLARLIGGEEGKPVKLLSGAPAASWWLLAVYVSLGLAALGGNAWRLRADPQPHGDQRRATAWVLVGSVFGLLPFLLSCALFPAFQHSQTFFFFGIMPLVLVPITFTYAIVRFQLLDIRILLRRSLLYTLTTAFITVLYAGGIAAFDHFFRGSIIGSRFFPILLALTIVLLFEPLRRRLQEPVDRFFFSGRSRLQSELAELSEAMAGQVDLEILVSDLVDRLPKLLELRFAALYLVRGDRLVRRAGPESLPAELPVVAELQTQLHRRAGLMDLDPLGRAAETSPALADWLAELRRHRVERLGELATRRREIGLVLLSDPKGHLIVEREDLELLRRLLAQAAIALETSLLLEERTQRAELERELEIAASIQAGLLPRRLELAPGFGIAASCRPARDVGGDFFAQLATQNSHAPAVVFADVSGKSVSGALMMMASHEVLHALAMTHPEPAALFTLANRRLYRLGRRSFVALGYLATSEDGERLRYLVAGQPAPLLRRADGAVVELTLPEHRLPLGALPFGEYHPLETPLCPGETVLAYSDGVTDALSPWGEPFGCERLQQVLAGAQGDPETTVAAVLAAVDAFTQGAQPYDDLTLIAVQRLESLQ